LISRIGKRTAFSLVELLVVIGIIVLLGSLLLSVIVRSRQFGREAACRSNLRQIATGLEIYRSSYGGGAYFPRWLTYLSRFPEGQPLISDPDVFICPFDRTGGAEGGRPDDLVMTDGTRIRQFANADIDEPDGKNSIKCSYLFEMNGEQCEWVYSNGSLIVPSGEEFEWRWIPNVDEFRERADLDGDESLSWYEVKLLTIQGWGPPENYLPSWGPEVPMVRCFWHVEGPVLGDDDWVLNVRSDFRVDKGRPRWASGQ